MKTKDTPVPVHNRKTKYPFYTMKVGDVFELDTHTQSESQKVSRAVWQFRFREKEKNANNPDYVAPEFAVQLFSDNKYRCTRTK